MWLAVTELLVVDKFGNGCGEKLRGHFLLGSWLVPERLLVCKSESVGTNLLGARKDMHFNPDNLGAMRRGYFLQNGPDSFL